MVISISSGRICIISTPSPPSCGARGQQKPSLLPFVLILLFYVLRQRLKPHIEQLISPRGKLKEAGLQALRLTPRGQFDMGSANSLAIPLTLTWVILW